MSIDKVIIQLKSIIEDKKYFVDKDDPNDIFKKDILALNKAILYLENYKSIIEED